MKRLETALNRLRYSQLSKLTQLFFSAIYKFFGINGCSYLTFLFATKCSNKTTTYVLCLSRNSFNLDITELEQRTDYKFAKVEMGYTRFQQLWWPKEMQIQTHFAKFNSNEAQNAIKKSTAYAEKLFDLFEFSGGRVSGVLSANIDYWQDEGFKNACKNRGIPFLVLCREHPVTSNAMAITRGWFENSGYKFSPDGVAVAGVQSKKTMLESNIACDPTKIFVTGLPRFDPWRDNYITNPLPLQERMGVTLLSFADGYEADETFKDVLNAFLVAASKNPSYDFYIKTKDYLSSKEIEKFVENRCAKNIHIIHKIPLFKLMQLSKIVVGYNSLSILEGVAYGCIILLPLWGECKNEGHTVMYTADKVNISGIGFCNSGSKLIEDISTYISNKECTNERPIDDIDKFNSQFVVWPTYVENSYNVKLFLDKYIN